MSKAGSGVAASGGGDEGEQAPLLAAALPRLADGEVLGEEGMRGVVAEILDGRVDEARLAALLMAVRLRGETPDELAGAVSALRERMTPVQAPMGAVDLCGTGGDGKRSLNVSTAAAFVVAACGTPVAKHGNRAASSASGASDVLAALGVETACPVPALEKALVQFNHAFLMAPRHHAAMRHAGPVRARLGLRTFFNLAGPLSNPARVKRQLLGCFSGDWLVPLAEAAGRLGSEALWAVHGAEPGGGAGGSAGGGGAGGGYDELTLFGANRAAVWCAASGGSVVEAELHPEDAGLEETSDEAGLAGGAPERNAEALRAVLSGERGTLAVYADTVALNAGAALALAEGSGAGGAGWPGLREASDRAREAMASGAALRLMEGYAAFTRQAAAKAQAAGGQGA